MPLRSCTLWGKLIVVLYVGWFVVSNLIMVAATVEH
jgi:hypothetical protein